MLVTDVSPTPAFWVKEKEISSRCSGGRHPSGGPTHHSTPSPTGRAPSHESGIWIKNMIWWIIHPPHRWAMLQCSKHKHTHTHTHTHAHTSTLIIAYYVNAYILGATAPYFTYFTLVRYQTGLLPVVPLLLSRAFQEHCGCDVSRWHTLPVLKIHFHKEVLHYVPSKLSVSRFCLFRWGLKLLETLFH